MYGLPKWYHFTHLDIYLGKSHFNAIFVALVLNICTVLVSHQYNVLFDGNFLAVTFMWEDPIPLNWAELVHRILWEITPENIDLNDTFFTPNIKDDPGELPNKNLWSHNNPSKIFFSPASNIPKFALLCYNSPH